MNIRYLHYLHSAAWRAKRAAVLARDGYRCQLWLAHPGEEVHHRTYAHLGDEPMEDLITLCRTCHDLITTAIRRERHRQRRLRPDNHVRVGAVIEMDRSRTLPLLADVPQRLSLPLERRLYVSIQGVQDHQSCSPNRE